jgi:hypothetical protein
VKSSYEFSYINYVEVVKTKVSDNQIIVSELYRFLRQSAVLVLENEHSDVEFIKMVLNCLKSRRLLETLGYFWVANGGGGCGEILKLVNKSIEQIEDHRRVCVVHDSDRLYPGAALQKIQNIIIEGCNDLGVDCVTLRKREIENYILDGVVRKLDVISEPIKKQFFSLTNDQKDYFDYKVGFKKLRKNDIGYGGLYDDLDDDSISEVRNGLGKDIAKLAFSPDMYDCYTEDAVRSRCQDMFNEFKEIEANLLKML